MPDTQISEALGLIDGGLQLLLAAAHADDPKREMLVRVGDLLRDVRSLQAALPGYAIVPREPTEHMLDMGACYEDPDGLYRNHSIFDEGDISRDIYRAMIQAAPPVASGHVVGWRTMDSAPKDGSRFWGKVGDDAIAMLWHPTFDAFVSSWHRMEMAAGYTIDDQPFKDHSPVIHKPEAWQPLPMEG